MRHIPGFVGYFATEDGRIFSRRDGLLELKQRAVDGYMNVTLSIRIHGKRERRRYPVHRLVCLAFHGESCRSASLARHLNGIRTDNRASNLAWGTGYDNASDAIRHGTLGEGMKSRRRKLTDEQVREIRRRLLAGEEDGALAKEFGVSRYYPRALLARKCWAALV